jgi:hypothetical protein
MFIVAGSDHVGVLVWLDNCGLGTDAWPRSLREDLDLLNSICRVRHILESSIQQNADCRAANHEGAVPATRKTAQENFELKAAEIAMASRTSWEVNGKTIALAALFRATFLKAWGKVSILKRTVGGGDPRRNS